MPKMKLTDAAVQRIKLPSPEQRQVDYWDALTPGFGLRVSFGGTKTWMVQARVLKVGKWTQTRRVVGRYPDMSLADARAAARDALALAAAGEDPKNAAKVEREKLEEDSRNSFAAIAADFLAKYVQRKGLAAKTAEAYVGTLQGKWTRAWAERPITSISRRDVHALIDDIIAQGFPIQANRSLAYLKRFFGWCVERGILDNAPTDHVKPPSESTRRERVLSVGEISEVWAALDKEGGVFAPMVKLLLLTAQRRDEVAGMRWSEITLEGEDPVWSLPAERTKNGLPNLIPLSPQAVKLLKSVNPVDLCPFVFTTTGKTYVTGYSKVKARLDTAIAEKREEAGRADPMEGWTFHDLRRTAATRMIEDLGVQPHIVEAVLNHISGHKAGVAGIYNRATYLPEKRRALEAWSEYVMSLAR